MTLLLGKRREDGNYKEQAKAQEVFDQTKVEEAERDEKGTGYKGDVSEEEQ